MMATKKNSEYSAATLEHAARARRWLDSDWAESAGEAWLLASDGKEPPPGYGTPLARRAAQLARSGKYQSYVEALDAACAEDPERVRQHVALRQSQTAHDDE